MEVNNSYTSYKLTDPVAIGLVLGICCIVCLLIYLVYCYCRMNRGFIDTDPDYSKFMKSLQNPEKVVLPTAENYLKEIMARERLLKVSNGILRTMTPLVEYIKQKKAKKMMFREKKREERRRREMERKRVRDEERKRRKAEKEKDKTSDKSRESDKDDGKESESEKTKSEPVVKAWSLLKFLRKPERDKEDEKEKCVCSCSIRDKPSRPLTDWERERRQRQRVKRRDRERDWRERREKERMGRRNDNRQSGGSKYQDWKKDEEFKDGANDGADEKDRGKKMDGRGKCSSYDHQWNKNRRWDEERFNRRGNNAAKPFERHGDFNRKSQEWKNEKREEVDKEEVDDGNLENLENAEVVEGNEELVLDDKDPRTERRIKNKHRLYRPRMWWLQRNSPQTDAQVGSESSSSSPSPTPTESFVRKGGNNDGGFFAWFRVK